MERFVKFVPFLPRLTIGFHNFKIFWDFTNTFFLLWAKWSKGKIVTEKHNQFLVELQKG